MSRHPLVAFCAATVSAFSVLALLAQTHIPSEIPSGPLGETIQLGKEVVEKTKTHPLSKQYVGNDLNCTNCHLKNGTHEKAATFMASASAYPAWSPREDRVITLEDRVLNCFMRSCNGVRPPAGSQVSVAVTTYITWLSQGQKMQMNARRPVGPGAIAKLSTIASQANKSNGEKLYQQKCAECHQENGLGDQDNPPVWGEQSYNDGAGLASVDNLAAWLKVAMPPDESNLSEQESVDIAAFVNSHARPHFALGEHLPTADKLGEYNGRKE